MFNFSQWCPRGLCYTKNDELFISLRSLNESQSKNVTYSGTTEIMGIQNDAQGKEMSMKWGNYNSDIMVIYHNNQSTNHFTQDVFK